jgi:cell division protein FtsI (penicillin-binding protein 3)
MKEKKYTWRFYFLLIVLGACFLALVARLVYLSVFNRSFLEDQGNSRALRVVDLAGSRGVIMDRNGVPIAISTPVDSVWINPQMFSANTMEMRKLATILHTDANTLRSHINHKKKHWFIYLKRHIPPKDAEQIDALHISGLFFQREYQRYYPEGEVLAHVLGFTNVDDHGQEGIELQYDKSLQGTPGKMQVIKDRLGHMVNIVGVLQKPANGKDLVLSIDRRIQYLAYYELKKAVQKYHAASGSAVVLDIATGEILAMVNQPSFNPNDRTGVTQDQLRNRAITDTFEPGSTIKTFSIASAIASKKYFPTTMINTHPGRFVVAGHVIVDDGVDHGVISLTEILQKSSNIGTAKVILSLPSSNLSNMLKSVGFGERTQSGFPGEAAGNIVDLRLYRPFVLATVSFGYGISATPLQLTAAYAVIGARGVKRPVTFLKVDQPISGPTVVNPSVTTSMVKMLQEVLEKGGTAGLAKVPGYKVAGKTGTAYIAENGVYNTKRHISSFIGLAPASAPRLVVAVIIKDPKGQDFGGIVAAPAFSVIMSGALRIMGVPPDDVV